MKEIIIGTEDKRQIVDITGLVEEELNDAGFDDGMVNLFVTHTTASVMVADMDPGGTDLDFLDAFEAMVPKLNFRHPHDPAHMPDHILSALVGVSVNIPVEDGVLILGSWQRVFLVDFNGGKERRINVTFITAK